MMWGHESKNVDSIEKLEKTRNGFSPRDSRGKSPANTLISALRGSFQASDLQNSQMKLCRFKPLSLLQFVTQQEETHATLDLVRICRWVGS